MSTSLKRSVLKEVLLLILLFIAIPAFACRCKPQGLNTYFERADYVFLAHLSENIKDGKKEIDFNLVGQPFKGDPVVLEKLVTANSSAACGVPVTESMQYLIFANVDPENPVVAEINTCNGTRPFSTHKPGLESDFTDFPASQVLKALYNLKITTKITKNGIGGVAKDNSVIGMLEFPELSEQGIERSLKHELKLSPSPGENAPIVQTIQTISSLRGAEISYEMPAPYVYGRSGTWSRVRTKSGQYSWVLDSNEFHFRPIESLLPQRLSYLTSDWDGLLWPSPGAGIPYELRRSENETAMSVIDSTRVADSLWFKVQIYKKHPCAGGEEKFSSTGWVPAWNAKGKLTAWFWSRGC